MSAATFLAAALLLCAPAAAFLDRDSGLHLFSLPETRSALHHASVALHGNSRWRMLQQRDGEYPEVHDSHEFVGSTPLGFISFNSSAIVKSTTVQTDDYMDLLGSATLDCAPRSVPSAHAGQGHVALTVTFPPGSPPDAEALAHLLDRLARPEAVLSIGVDTLLMHPSMDKDGSCGRHVPGRDPFFSILAVVQEGSSLSLDLSPASPRDAFHYLSFNLQHTPDAHAEVARRRELGLWTGRELAIKYEKTIAEYAVNWNKDTANPGAAVSKLSVFESAPDALYCKDCFFYLGATLNINVQVCFAYQAAQVKYYLDANMPENVVKSGYGYFYQYASSAEPGYTSTSDTAAKAKTDCAALEVPMTSSTTFNVGLSAEVFFSGAAAFNFQINSDGIKETLKFPSTCSSPSTGCTPTQLLAPIVLGTITVPVAGIPITIDPTITLSAAAVADLKMPDFRLQFGAGAKVNLKLGGKVAFSGVPSNYVPSFTYAAYKDFTASYSQVPFKLSGFENAAGSIDATITPVINVKVWKIFPFTMTPSYNMKHTLAASSTSSRLLGLRGEAHERALQTCTTGQVSSKAEAKGALGVTLDKVTAFGLIKTITGKDLSSSSIATDFDAIPAKTLVDPTSATFSVDGAVSAAATACVAKGKEISTGGTTSAAPAGAAASAGGGSGSSDSACGPGCIAGAIIGSVLGATLIFIVAVHCLYVSGKNPAPSFLKPLVSCLGGSSAVAPVITSAPSAAATAAAKMPAEPAPQAPAPAQARA